MNKIVITLDESKSKKDYYECAELVLEENGIKQKRMVELSSLLSAFSKSTCQKPKSIRLGRMPVGYYDGTICEEDGLLRADVLIILPKCRQVMQYEKTRYDVCVPSLAFLFRITQSRVNSTRIFALKDDRPTEKSLLFVYPFGNVNINSGSACWGTNLLKQIEFLKDLDEIVALFIQSECNEDHYRLGESCTLAVPLRSLFDMLQDVERFPEELLIERTSRFDYRTLGDIMKQFTN